MDVRMAADAERVDDGPGHRGATGGRRGCVQVRQGEQAAHATDRDAGECAPCAAVGCDPVADAVTTMYGWVKVDGFI